MLPACRLQSHGWLMPHPTPARKNLQPCPTAPLPAAPLTPRAGKERVVARAQHARRKRKSRVGAAAGVHVAPAIRQQHPKVIDQAGVGSNASGCGSERSVVFRAGGGRDRQAGAVGGGAGGAAGDGHREAGCGRLAVCKVREWHSKLFLFQPKGRVERCWARIAAGWVHKLNARPSPPRWTSGVSR